MPRSARFAATLIFFSCSILGVSNISNAQTSLPPSWLYSTYFGGTGSDVVSATAVDSAGNIYVAGTSSSADFPTTPGVYEPTYPGPSGYEAVFVSKFSPDGALGWTTFLGPGSYQFVIASGLAVDAAQNVYVSGVFQDPGFPTTTGLPDSGSVFAAKLNSTGSQ